MKYWEIIADNLSKTGWSLGYLSGVASNGRKLRNDNKPQITNI
jgi:hypothetical protein